MKALVVGSGGREYALAGKLAQSPKIDVVYCAPGNAGTANLKKDGELIGKNINIKADDNEGLANFAKKERIGLTVVGPELPLVNGIEYEFRSRDLPLFGPSREAAMLEGNKIFAKELMAKYNIPQARPYSVVSKDREPRYLVLEEGLQYIRDNWEKPDKLVIKAYGLAAGKGAKLPETKEEAYLNLIKMISENELWPAGRKVIIEPRLKGREVSYIVITDGKSIKPLMPVRDYKRIGDGDTGENTGGMGGLAPLDELTEDMKKEIENKIIYPTLEAMRSEGRPFKGTLYAGLMIPKEEGPKVLEYNVRGGDPETQLQMFMMAPEVDIVPYLLACINGNLSELPDFKWKSGYGVGVVLASKGYPGKPEKNKLITFGDMSNLDFDYHISHAGTRLGEDGKLYTDGGRVLLCAARGKTPPEAKYNAYLLSKLISFEGAYSRSDIGSFR
ncbi:MAG: phosphoribosylamine--glycine ligase [Candidatus Aenigmarchaeota archaeon]|nr:phosphoribosylamine--glycine ligase [Candidatus Aenigmarchaeota archaeon]